MSPAHEKPYLPFSPSPPKSLRSGTQFLHPPPPPLELSLRRTCCSPRRPRALQPAGPSHPLSLPSAANPTPHCRRWYPVHHTAAASTGGLAVAVQTLPGASLFVRAQAHHLLEVLPAKKVQLAWTKIGWIHLDSLLPMHTRSMKIQSSCKED
ncbi:uncharacterized protein LOC119310279 [Triticum dicoccoides]|uniref:uncharacterized protein LOC119310279 n=1 Tax=Triticum dicoccoides TaxID=85692 RepID=UPI0018910264|nr:uncharacterized protein LOC119310279 [Triticum dicoccoides]